MLVADARREVRRAFLGGFMGRPGLRAIGRGPVTAMAAFLLAGGLGLPVGGAAQSALRGGERVRVEQTDGAVLTGVLSSLSAETIELTLTPTGQTVAVPVRGIWSVETSAGPQRRLRKYFGITAAAASVLGASIWAATWSPCTPTVFLECLLHPESRGEAVAYGLVGGLVVGVPLGLIVGLVVKEERWDPAALPGRRAPALSVRPVMGERMGFVASVRLGGS